MKIGRFKLNDKKRSQETRSRKGGDVQGLSLSCVRKEKNLHRYPTHAVFFIFFSKMRVNQYVAVQHKKEAL